MMAVFYKKEFVWLDSHDFHVFIKRDRVLMKGVGLDGEELGKGVHMDVIPGLQDTNEPETNMIEMVVEKKDEHVILVVKNGL